MARIFSFILFFIIIVLGLFFGNINADAVKLDYYWGDIHLPLSIALVLSLLCGAVLGVFATLKLLVRQRYQINLLRKEIKLAEKEVDNLRTIPLKDDH